jgi:hypothetical protein
MSGRCLAYAAAFACFASPAVLTGAYAQTQGVIELFTSQGCSSCPAADKLLAELAADPKLVAITLPIDYWDYLGWKDTLADPRNTARQKAYAKVRGDREVYTPQVVANGAMHALGSDKTAIQRAIVQTAHNAAALPVKVTLSIANGRLAVALPEHAASSNAEIWICGLAKAVTVTIKRGENHGKTITYTNVARRWLKLDPGAAGSNGWSVPIRDLDGDGINAAAVLVQTGTVEKPNAILGAAFASIR